MPQIEPQTRIDIAAFLPRALETAIKSYKNFAEDQAEKPADSVSTQDFKAHHDACKIAIAHIELLIKLAQWADLPDPEVLDADKNQMLIEIIQNGKIELNEGSA